MTQTQTLEMALTIHQRVFSQIRDSEGATDIQVERHFRHSLDDEGSILDACFFTVAAVKSGELIQSFVCRDYGELEDAITKNFHGGRELAHGEHWGYIVHMSISYGALAPKGDEI